MTHPKPIYWNLVIVLALCILGIDLVPSHANAQSNEEKRDVWQQTPDIFEAMGIQEGSHVADIGAESGYFTERLSKAVGTSGRVYAVDIKDSALRKLRERADRNKLDNVETVKGKTDDPNLPDGKIDAILICNAYHEMTEYKTMLKHMLTALKPGGRLVLVEPITPERQGRSRKEQAGKHEIGIEYAIEDLTNAGFVIIQTRYPFLKRASSDDEEWILVGRKK